MDYIKTHQEEVETEYQLVVKQAEKIRQYWEEKNQERLAKIASMGPPPGKEEVWAKVQAKKKQLGLI